MESENQTASGQISYLTVLRQRDVRSLAMLRVIIKLGSATIAYGVMVHLARLDASQLQISIVGATTYIAALLFGAQGGMIADAVAKRRLIALGCLFEALLCFLIPLWLGTGVAQLMTMMFLSSTVVQFTSPGLKAVVALISNDAEMATTGALVSIIGSTASAIGSSLVAPLLIKLQGIDLVFLVCGTIFLIGAVRALSLPHEEGATRLATAGRRLNWRPVGLSPKAISRWIVQDQRLSSMVLLGACVTALYEAFVTLMPVYVRDVLNTDPALSIYIFSLASIGFLIGAVGGPWLIARWGERQTMTYSLISIAAGMVLFGMVRPIAPFLAPFSPLRIIELFGLETNDRILAASIIAIPANLGSSLASLCIQVYINRTVATTAQATAFGMQEVQKNLMNTFAVLAIGIVAIVLPIQKVLIFSPIIVVVMVMRLLQFSHRDHMHMTTKDAWRLLIGTHEASADASRSGIGRVQQEQVT